MTRRFDFADTMTPADGTAISEWMRFEEYTAHRMPVGELREAVASLIRIRFAATDGWTPELRAEDSRCEHQLREIIRGLATDAVLASCR